MIKTLIIYGTIPLHLFIKITSTNAVEFGIHQNPSVSLIEPDSTQRHWQSSQRKRQRGQEWLRAKVSIGVIASHCHAGVA
jgi:hypothetical protein